MTRAFHEIFSVTAKERLRMALEEDVGPKDITSEILVPKTATAKAVILAKETGILCGAPVVKEIFYIVDPSVEVRFLMEEGRKFTRNRRVMEIEGNVRSILQAERTALNFLGRLSGVATKTHAFVQQVKADLVFILDTRKTTPLLREFEKYAVRIGGGKNHRMGLHDAIFVKENHRRFGDLEKLKRYRHQFEIEVRNMKELKEALALAPQVILFDNFKPAALHRAVRYTRRKQPHVILEASGGISMENVAHYSAMGIDWISVGGLTHSLRTIDFSLLIE
ncbi:MAG: carboxylating nicotinate-nucleotide diphosphorylase [Candidatus Omnitrophota bacterium]